MTLPIEVWGIERADGSLQVGRDDLPILWATEKPVVTACGEDPEYRPVPLRIVRRDEAAAEAVESLRHSVDMLLRMVAMVPERDLTSMIADPYGVIGDALESIGKPRTPDAWRALSMHAHGFDCGEQKPEAAREDPHAMVNALTDFERGYSPLSSDPLQDAVYALVRMAQRKDAAPAPAPVTRAEFEALRECVATLADITENMACQTEVNHCDIVRIGDLIRSLDALRKGKEASDGS